MRLQTHCMPQCRRVAWTVPVLVLASFQTLILAAIRAPRMGGRPLVFQIMGYVRDRQEIERAATPILRQEVRVPRLNPKVEMNYTHIRAAEASLGDTPPSSCPIRCVGLDLEQLREARRRVGE